MRLYLPRGPPSFHARYSMCDYVFIMWGMGRDRERARLDGASGGGKGRGREVLLAKSHMCCFGRF